MANFSTHLLGAIVIGIVSTSILGTVSLLPLASMASGVAVVALGGIFPDVDSDRSDAISLVFDTLSVGVAAPLMIATVPMLGLPASLVLMVVAYLAIRFVFIVPFRWFTVHRGRFHSIPMGLLCSGIVALVAHRGLLLSPIDAWVFGGLFLLGFLTHLTLDELYSVDLANQQIKRSFGTALKLGNRGDLRGYAGLYALLVGVMVLAPSPMPLVHALADARVPLLPSDSVLALLARL